VLHLVFRPNGNHARAASQKQLLHGGEREREDGMGGERYGMRERERERERWAEREREREWA
jgi:hypothetical protein